MQCRDGGGSAGAGTWPRHPTASRSRSLHGCRGSAAAVQVGCLKLGCLWPRVFSGVLGKETSLKPEDEQQRCQASLSLFQGGPSWDAGSPRETRTSGRWVMVRDRVIMSLLPKRSFLLCFSLG